jgi:prepilin-type N-terminal cleavage/methylation domain-containing protein
MKKGFTLIEILAVVTIIGLIFILVIPKIATSLKNKKGDVDTTTNNIVLAAAKSYVQDNRDKFEKVDSNTYCLPISTLTKKEYLESPVKNVTDDVDITNTKSVRITYNKGFKYEIVDKSSCEYVINRIYKEYKIGDVIEFAGSNWYVIENSSKFTDYVTLLKENTLTAEELTENYRITSNGTVTDKMAYYWNDTCHQGSSSLIYYYGLDGQYDTTINSGCRGAVKTYDKSKVKEFLENTYIKSLNDSNLKEIDGYKIRLLSLNELIENFDYSESTNTNYKKGLNTPSFIYSDQYMINYNNSYYLWYMNLNGNCKGNNGVYIVWKIRPVINLYKDSILEQ